MTIVIQIAGSPFDDRTLLEVEADDGTLQAVYVSNEIVDYIGTDDPSYDGPATPIYSDETATLVYQYPDNASLAERFEEYRRLDIWSDRTIVISQD